LKKNRCPRCDSVRLEQRLDGAQFCKRCGQRWKGKVVFRSKDKRQPSKLSGKSLSAPSKKKQLSLF